MRAIGAREISQVETAKSVLESFNEEFPGYELCLQFVITYSARNLGF